MLRDSCTSSQLSGHFWMHVRITKDPGIKNSKMGAPHRNGQQKIKK